MPCEAWLQGWCVELQLKLELRLLVVLRIVLSRSDGDGCKSERAASDEDVMGRRCVEQVEAAFAPNEVECCSCQASRSKGAVAVLFHLLVPRQNVGDESG